MGRSIQIRLMFLWLTLASAVSAQTPATCGVVGVDGPTEVEYGAPLRFKAKISRMNSIAKPEFKWVVSLATITTGQGTNEITIDTVGLGGMTLTASAFFSKVPPGCAQAASITYVGPAGAGPPPCSSSEVPFSKVKFTKPHPNSSRKH